MKSFWLPLVISLIFILVGIALLKAIPENKKPPRRAAVSLINIGVALMLAVAVGMFAILMMTP